MTSATSETTPGFRWDRLTVASAAGYAYIIPALSVGAVLGELRDQFAISGFVAALHGSAFGIGLLLMGMFGTTITRRLGLVGALRLATGTITLGVVVLCLGRQWPLTLTGATLSGLAAALLVMIMPGVISDHHGPNRATAFAAVNAVPGLMAIVFSGIVGGALALGWSWRPAYLGASVAILAVLVTVAWPVPLPPPVASARSPLRLLTDPVARRPWLRIVVAVATEFPIGIWSAAYLKEVGGASSGVAAGLAGLFGFMLFVSRVVMPRTLRRLGSGTLAASFALVGTGAVLMCATSSLPLIIAGIAVAGFGAGPLYPLTVDRLYIEAVDSTDAVTLGAVSALASGTAVTLAPLTMGVIADAVSLRWAVLLSVALAALGIAMHRPNAGAAKRPDPRAAT